MHGCCRSAGIAQLVERNLAKVEVESSRLFSRSKFRREAQLPFFVRKLFRFLFVFEFIRRDQNSSPWRGSKVVMQRPAKP